MADQSPIIQTGNGKNSMVAIVAIVAIVILAVLLFMYVLPELQKPDTEAPSKGINIDISNPIEPPPPANAPPNEAPPRY